MLKLTNALENYLEVLLELASISDNDGVRITDIADKLNVSKASANKAMNNLASLELITNEKYQQIFLTTKGKTLAIKLQHKHNTIKNFLVKSLNISEKLADEEACKIEHVIDEELFIAMEKYNDKV